MSAFDWLAHTPLGNAFAIVALFSLFIAWGFQCQRALDRQDAER